VNGEESAACAGKLPQANATQTVAVKARIGCLVMLAMYVATAVGYTFYWVDLQRDRANRRAMRATGR
jgi:hypothetical protein